MDEWYDTYEFSCGIEGLSDFLCGSIRTTAGSHNRASCTWSSQQGSRRSWPCCSRYYEIQAWVGSTPLSIQIQSSVRNRQVHSNLKKTYQGQTKEVFWSSIREITGATNNLPLQLALENLGDESYLFVGEGNAFQISKWRLSQIVE